MAQHKKENTTGLNNFSTEQLERELVKRKCEEELPPPLPNPDFKKLVSEITEIINIMAAEKYQEEDMPHQIYERTLETIFGEAYFKWRNAQKW